MKRTPFKNKIQKPMKRSPLKAKKGFKKKSFVKSFENGFKKNPYKVMKGKKLFVGAGKKKLTPQAQADKLFSEITRRSNSRYGLGMCATCFIVKPWKEMQCGHFRPRQHIATRYLKSNVFNQCEDCNCFHDGRLNEFGEFLNLMYGPGHVQYLTELSYTIVPSFNYKELIEKLKEELRSLVELQDNEIQY